MKEGKAVAITLEKTADGFIIDGLEEGFVSVPPSMVYDIVTANDVGTFFPYEIHPLLYRGEPVRHFNGVFYLFRVSLTPDIRW